MDDSDNKIMINKIAEYRKKLLDTSLKSNGLLNFKKTSYSIKISGIDENITDLFDILVLKEKEMLILSLQFF